jgi:hypothetical protein
MVNHKNSTKSTNDQQLSGFDETAGYGPHQEQFCEESKQVHPTMAEDVNDVLL